MALWLRVLAAFEEDTGLVLSTQMIANKHCNSSSKGSNVLFWPLSALDKHLVHRYNIGITLTYKNKFLK